MQEKEYNYKLRELNCIFREIRDLRVQYNEKKEVFNSMLHDLKSIRNNKGKPVSNLSLVKDYFVKK